MDESTYISVKGSNERYDDFVRFMDATTQELKDSAVKGIVDYSNHQGEKLEWVVLDYMKSLASQFDFKPEAIIHTEKQHFPDIISENYFGVEVKATKEKTWVSTGSSITESLRDNCVKKVFLLFGRLSVPDVDFRCKPYEDCMYDISVTHNPRYLINMDLSIKDQTIFEKLGLGYDDFRIDSNRIDIIRNYYREKYRNNDKEMPWWIGEEPDNGKIHNEGSIRLYSTLSKAEKDYLTLCGFILFPEVLNSQYGKMALWLCSRHSVVNPNIRDMYSAGGQMDIYIDGEFIVRKAPKSFCNFLTLIDLIRGVFQEKSGVYHEISYYADYFSNVIAPYDTWKNNVVQYLPKSFGIGINEIMGLTFEGVIDNRVLLRRLSI